MKVLTLLAALAAAFVATPASAMQWRVCNGLDHYDGYDRWVGRTQQCHIQDDGMDGYAQGYGGYHGGWGGGYRPHYQPPGTYSAPDYDCGDVYCTREIGRAWNTHGSHYRNYYPY